ncbi:MAG: PadR family transcriptional regulator [Acidimicrobiales bacterium]
MPRTSSSLLEMALLGVLRELDLHGYELKRRLEELTFPAKPVSFGSLYPALARLEAAGSVEIARERLTTGASAGTGALAGTGDPSKVSPAAGNGSARALPLGGPVPNTGSLSGELAAIQAARRLLRVGTAPSTISARAFVSARRARKVYRLTEAGRGRFREMLGTDLGAVDDQEFQVRATFASELPADARARLFERRWALQAERLRQATNRLDEAAARGPYAAALIHHSRDMVEADLRWLEAMAAQARAEVERASYRPSAASSSSATTGMAPTGG